MRLGVLGDTHGVVSSIRCAVECAGKVDAWLHTGDVISDAKYLENLTKIPVYCVSGNCDWAGSAPEEQVLEFDGCRLLLLHGHRYGVKYGLHRLFLHAEELECFVAVFGHTHQPLLDKVGNVLLLNPGSAAQPRGYKASCAVLTIESGKASAEIIPL